MGPLVPDLIGNELNFVVALFIGIAFGFILEQAGFSSSKKLVGLFYGYDFTVLRVFFTAGVTACLGVVALAHFGLLDLNLIYVNPTFLWSALVGGLIMGLGFVLGGYCPGTSVCAAAIGRVDAMLFVGGSFIGVLIFAEGYPLFEGLYKAANWGSPRIFEVIGVSQSLFAFLLTFIAVFAFWAVTFIESKVNKTPSEEFKTPKLYYGITAIALILGLSAFLLPDLKDDYLTKVSDKEFVNNYKIDEITSDELAYRLMDQDKSIQIIDVRKAKDYSLYKLPQSINLTAENMFEKDTKKIMLLKGKENIFLAENELEAKKAAVIADMLEYKNIRVLKGGFAEFKKSIIGFSPNEVAHTRQEGDTRRFREQASKVIPVLIEQNKNTTTTKKVSKRVIGGC